MIDGLMASVCLGRATQHFLHDLYTLSEVAPEGTLQSECQMKYLSSVIVYNKQWGVFSHVGRSIP